MLYKESPADTARLDEMTDTTWALQDLKDVLDKVSATTDTDTRTQYMRYLVLNNPRFSKAIERAVVELFDVKRQYMDSLTTPEQETISQEANRIVYGDREETYDHPSKNFERIAKIWSVIFDHPVTLEQVALAMIGVKISREVHKPKRDNLVDIIGYTITIEKMENSGADIQEGW